MEPISAPPPGVVNEMYFAGIFSDPVLHFHHSHALPKQFFMQEAVMEDAFHQITAQGPR